MPDPIPRSRAGLHLILVSLLLVMAAASLSLLSAQRQTLSSDWVRRVEQEMIQADLLESALEEALSTCLEEVNTPGSSLFDALRDGTLETISFPFEAPWCQERGRTSLGSKELKVTVSFEERAAFSEDDFREWGGRLHLLATLGDQEAGRIHDVRGVRVTLPAPFDSTCFYSWKQPEPEFPEGELTLEPADLAPMATIRLQPKPGGSIQQVFDSLIAGLDALSGVILVENTPDDPLVLRDWQHRGRTLLVTLGPLELLDVRMEDPTRDQLSVLALGEIELGGDVEASVGLSQPPGSPSPRRTLLPGLEITGSLVLTAGTYTAPRETNLRCRPESPEGPSLLAFQIGISPDPIERWQR